MRHAINEQGDCASWCRACKAKERGEMQLCYLCGKLFPADELDGTDSRRPEYVWCIFCDQPDEDNSHATPGVKPEEAVASAFNLLRAIS